MTYIGKGQAERLGSRWANVRINALYASKFKRAKDTAQALADANTSIHEVEESSLIGERCIGSVAQHYLGTGQRDAYIQAVNNGANHPYVDRAYVPPGGGESLNAVNLRARLMLLRIMDQHGANIDTVPEEYRVEDLFNLGSKLESDPEKLPDGIPHVVLVSHNVFLAEFYEMLLNWKKAEHTTTFTDFGNTGWCVAFPSHPTLVVTVRRSRHLIRYRCDESGLEVQFYNLNECCGMGQTSYF